MLRRTPIRARPLGQLDTTELDELIATLSEAIQSDPTDAQAYYERGMAYMRKGRHQRRRDYLGRGDLDKAIADFTHVIRLGAKDFDVYMRRGATYQANDDLDKAIADFTQAIRIAPKEPRAYLARADAHERKGDRDKAGADRGSARQLTAASE